MSRRGAGQSMLEAAVAFPVLLMVAIGLVQFALFAHAQNVVTGAVQDGARVAAADGRTVSDGVSRAEDLLHAGLGQIASNVEIKGDEDGEAVVVEADGSLHTIIPWAADATLPLRSRAVVSKEKFRAGPSK
jgi:Flp pilus assembly protein TadG